MVTGKYGYLLIEKKDLVILLKLAVGTLAVVCDMSLHETLKYIVACRIYRSLSNERILVTDSWTIYDISEYTEDGADTFYTLVGLVAGSDNWGSRLTSAGVYVYIYGDKTGDGEHYELLAASELLKGYNLGEFNVNVEGVKLLLIDVILPETATSHGYSGVGFGNACLFTADADAEKPDYTGDMPVEDDEWGDEEEDDVTTTTKPTTTKPTTPSTTDDAEDEKSGLGVAAIVAIVAGVVVVIAIAAVIVITKRKPNVAATAETTVETAGTENNENDGSNSDNT